MEEHTNKHKLKIGSKLGAGSFGVVYKATYDGVDVAIKTLAEQHGSNKVALRMFLREARMLQKIQHQNVIGFRALCKLPCKAKGGESTVQWALVLELLKDGSLFHKICQQMTNPQLKAYSDRQAVQWALDVARGLEHLHHASPATIHRDIKLSNILLKQEGGRLVAKISDFGLHVVPEMKHQRMLRMTQSPDSGASPFVPLPQAGAPILPSIGSGAFYRPSDDMTEGMQQLQQLQQEYEEEQATRATSGHYGVGHIAGGLAGAEAGKDLVQEDGFYGEFHTGNSRSSTLRVYRSSDGTLPRLDGSSCSTAYATAIAGPDQTQSQALKSSSKPRLCSTSPLDPSNHSEGSSVGLGGAGLSAVAGRRQLIESCGSSCCSMDSGMCTDISVEGGSMWGGSDAKACAEVQMVYNLTAETGSCMYMAPEVHLREPYNEKVDVFSFGVVLYELISRTTLLFTELPTSHVDVQAPDRYAARVAEGYRPARSKAFSDEAWELVSQCWATDPLARPSMSEVVDSLEGMLERLEALKATKSGRAVAAGGAAVTADTPGPAAQGCSCIIA